MTLWEGLLVGRSYPRLSPSVLSCAGSGSTKKTCAPFIPALSPLIPQVIPDFINPAKAMWKSRWKSGGLLLKKPPSNLNRRKVVHKNDSKCVDLFNYKYFMWSNESVIFSWSVGFRCQNEREKGVGTDHQPSASPETTGRLWRLILRLILPAG